MAVLVKVTLINSTVIGFTTHDDNIVLGGVTYEAYSAIQASQLRADGGVDNMDIIGLLSSDRIKSTDVIAGLYDNADVQVSICNWNSLSDGAMTLFTGYVGNITLEDSKYTAELRSLSQRMKQLIGHTVGNSCDAVTLGDGRCKVVLTGNTVDGHAIQSNATIGTIESDHVFDLIGAVSQAGFYTHGTIKFTSGLNAGLSREIKLHSASNGLDVTTIHPAPTSFGGLSALNNNHQAVSASFAFTIPAGSWQSATLEIDSSWTLVNALNPGSDVLQMQMPVGAGYQFDVRQNNITGTFQDFFSVGQALMLAIQNASGGGTVAGNFRHTSYSGNGLHYLNISVTAVSLVLTGAAAGATERIILQEPFPYPVSPGDACQITAGCDRYISTCKAKYNNVLNFRGFPTVPGSATLMKVGRGG